MLQLTAEFYGKDLFPKDVLICLCNYCGPGGGTASTLASLSASNTIKCRGHRANTEPTMWALGLAGSTASTCKKPQAKTLIGRGAALVGVYSHSAVNNDAFR